MEKGDRITLNVFDSAELVVFLDTLQTDIKDMTNFLSNSGEFVHTKEIERFVNDLKNSVNELREDLKI